jgi:hypothetical protein
MPVEDGERTHTFRPPFERIGGEVFSKNPVGRGNPKNPVGRGNPKNPVGRGNPKYFQTQARDGNFYYCWEILQWQYTTRLQICQHLFSSLA